MGILGQRRAGCAQSRGHVCAHPSSSAARLVRARGGPPRAVSRTPAGSPVRWLSALTAGGAVLWLAAILLVLREPWLGLELAVRDDTVRVAAASGPAAAVPTGVRLLSVGAPGGEALPLLPGDLIEEPDYLDTYPAMAELFARQTRLRELLSGPVQLRWTGPDGKPGEAQVLPQQRPLASLPAGFWFQLACGSLATLIGAWVWRLQPASWSTRMLALTGAAFLSTIWATAIYSSRALALDGTLFRWLSSANHLSALVFGCGLVALMLSYPRLAVRARWLALPFAVFLPWWLTDALRLAPDQDWGMRIPILLEMCLAIGVGLWQWYRTRGDLLARAALRWMLLSVLVGCGLFVFIMVGSTLLGSLPPLPQAYAMGFFLIMYVGLALGVGRYRLFELDRWAYRVLLWVLGAALVLALDAALISALHLAPDAALLVATLASGWLYFPLRQWLLLRMLRPTPPVEQSLAELVSLAMTPEAAGRARQWRELLAHRFAPARTTDLASDGPARATLLDEGLALAVPAHHDCPALRLDLRDGGRSLFSGRDVRFVDGLVELMEQTVVRRAALEAATQAERQRIAKDLHDDLGSRLLMLIHRSPDETLAGIAREGMADLRSILGALDGPGAPLAEVLANSRAEARARCEAAGTALLWQQALEQPSGWLPSHTRSVLERCLRELVTNALKHARPPQLEVRVQPGADRLDLAVVHELPAGTVLPWTPGRGLQGLASRLAPLGGALRVEPEAPGRVRAVLELPL